MGEAVSPSLPRLQPLWSEEGAPTALAGRLAEAYGAPLAFEPREDRPVIVANFVSTLDGVVSYATPEAAGGGEISGFYGPDRFVMSILRGLADAVLIGAGTLRAGVEEAWTPDDIFPDAAADIADLRRGLGLAPQPATVVVSAGGEIDPMQRGLRMPGVPALVMTTRAGAQRLGESGLEAIVAGEDRVETSALVDGLWRRGFGLVVCEGGPHLFGGLLEAGLVDELFLTVAPQIAGRSRRSPRLGLVEGLAFSVADAPWWRLVSIARSGEHLFLRYRRADDA